MLQEILLVFCLEVESSEISQLMPVYLDAAKKLLNLNANTYFLIPAANQKLAEMIESTKGINEIPYKLSIDSAQDFLSLSSISIVTSGTASLEAAVLGSVPIICYKTNKPKLCYFEQIGQNPICWAAKSTLAGAHFP